MSETQAERVLKGMYIAQRSVAAQRRPWMLWGISFVIAFSMLGYPIAASVAQIFGLESTVTSYPFRGTVVALCMVVIIGGGALGQFKLPLITGIFMTIYLIRMVWDSEFAGVPFAQRDLLFYTSSALLPALAMCCAHYYYEERNAAITMAAIGTLSCTFIIYALVYTKTLTGEVGLNQRNYFESLNPITIGYTGLLTMVAGYACLDYITKAQRAFIIFPLLGIGLATFLLGGSRGPLVGAILFFALLAIVKQRGIIAIALVILGLALLFAATGGDWILFNRFVDIANDGAVRERLYFQELALEQAFVNPFFGSAYVELRTLSYPHNLIIEAGMALGIAGAVLMIILQLRLIRDLLLLLRAGHILMPMIGTTAFANAWISGSLPAARDFYIALILCSLIATRIRFEDQQQRLQKLRLDAVDQQRRNAWFTEQIGRANLARE